MSPDVPTYLSERLAEQSARLAALEQWKTAQDTTSAVRTERDKHLDLRFDRIEASQNEIKGYLLKIVWVIILGVLGAFITFMAKGGLSGPF